MHILISRVSIILVFLLASVSASSQKKKELEEAIDTLMVQRSYERAMPLLKKYIALDPEDAHARFRLATAHRELMKKLYLHEEQMLKLEYDSAISLYEQAIRMVDKKELRRNRLYYQRVFFDREFVESDVVGFFQQYQDDAEEYYGRLAFLRVKLLLIQQAYIDAERLFRSIIAPYKKIPDLHRGASEEEIEKIRRLQLLTNQVEQSIEGYEQVFANDPIFEKRQKQQFSWQEINGLNLYAIGPSDFKRRELKLFDFGSWARTQLDYIYKFRKVKNELMAFHETIATASTASPINLNTDTARIHRDLLQWREKLLQYHAESAVPKLLFYEFGKLSLLMEEEGVRRAFAKVYPDQQTRDILINQIVRQVMDLQEQLNWIPADTAAYSSYADYLNLCCGSANNIVEWKAFEKESLAQHLQHWNSIRAKTALLKPSLPDSMSAGNKVILLRSAKFDLREASTIGWYINENIYYLPDSSFISQGRYTKDGGTRPYLALIDAGAKVRWIYDFPDKQEWCEKLSKLKVYEDGSSCYFAYRKKNGVDRISLEYLSPSGKIEYNRIMVGMPEEVFYTKEPKGIVLLRKAVEGEGDRSFSRLEMEGYSFEGKNQGKPILTRFLIRGHIAGMAVHDGGVFLVANFLEYQDMNGNFSDSRAYRKGGFNVLGLNLSLKRNQAIFDPVFSMQPIIVTGMHLEKDGKLRLTGLQGDYEYYSPTNVTGGKPWQRYLTP